MGSADRGEKESTRQMCVLDQALNQCRANPGVLASSVGFSPGIVDFHDPPIDIPSSKLLIFWLFVRKVGGTRQHDLGQTCGRHNHVKQRLVDKTGITDQQFAPGMSRNGPCYDWGREAIMVMIGTINLGEFPRCFGCDETACGPSTNPRQTYFSRPQRTIGPGFGLKIDCN